MSADNWTKWPFGFLSRRWSRVFLVTAIAMLLFMTCLDIIFSDFEYIRLLDKLILLLFFLLWFLLFWIHPGFFKR